MTEATYRPAEQQFWAHYGIEPKEHFVELATLATTVRVQEVGSGDPTLFLHGWPASGTVFAPLVASLGDFAAPGSTNHAPDRLSRARSFRCLVPDLPPGGLSAPFELTEGNVRTVLDHLVTDVLDALGVDRAHLVASSTGSTFAMHAAVRASDRVRGAVHLGAPWLVEGMPVPGGEKLMLVPGVRRILTAMTPGRRMQKSMLKSIGHGHSIAAGRIPAPYWEWYDALLTGTGTYAAQMRTLSAFTGKGMTYDRTLQLGDEELAAQGPTLVIWGADEGLASHDDARALIERIPGARLEQVPDAGHLPWLDAPDAVAASVRGFLGGIE